jgi:hypothetical protein
MVGLMKAAGSAAEQPENGHTNDGCQGSADYPGGRTTEAPTWTPTAYPAPADGCTTRALPPKLRTGSAAAR